MRLFESVLLIISLLALIRPIVPYFQKLPWTGYIAPAAVVIAIVQIIGEGYHWQMVPAYAIALILGLVWLYGRITPKSWRLKKYHRLAKGVAFALGITAWAVAVALPLLLPVFALPKPTGPFHIGTFTYHWTENTSELFDPNSGTHRQLMAQIWYPVSSGTSSARAPYLDDAAALSATFGKSAHLPLFFLDHLEYIKTNAIPSAPIASSKPSYPVLVFLTGVVGYRQSNTVQIEELVSHGYIVVGIDQPYAAAAVRFPNGHIISGWTRDQIQPLINQSLAPTAPAPAVNGHSLQEGIIPYLSSDVSFTLDQLAAINQKDPADILTGRLDLARTGAFGVSLGAMVTGQACHDDPRIKACLMMDAAMPADVVQTGLRQPAMWLTRPASDMQAEHWAASDITLTTNSMRAVYQKESPSQGYYVQIPGMFHANFTDAPLFSPLASQLGLAGPKGTQGFAIINNYSLAFFNHCLQGTDEPLLNGPPRQYPDVLYEKR